MTETDNNQAITHVKSHRGPYKATERKFKVHEIERLLAMGYNNEYIQDKLSISPATYNRYRKLAFADSKNAMLALDVGFVTERIIQSDRRFGELSALAIRLAEDKTMDSDSRVAAINCAAEIEQQRVFLTLKDGPEIISRLHGYPKSPNRIVEQIAAKHNLPNLQEVQPSLPSIPDQTKQEDKHED